MRNIWTACGVVVFNHGTFQSFDHFWLHQQTAWNDLRMNTARAETSWRDLEHKEWKRVLIVCKVRTRRTTNLWRQAGKWKLNDRKWQRRQSNWYSMTNTISPSSPTHAIVSSLAAFILRSFQVDPSVYIAEDLRTEALYDWRTVAVLQLSAQPNNGILMPWLVYKNRHYIDMMEAFTYWLDTLNWFCCTKLSRPLPKWSLKGQVFCQIWSPLDGI